jgi:hypothetical protein
MTKEALKLALEALQNPWKAGPDGVADAIIAIKAALEAPKRTWIGITDEEIVLIVAECAASHQHTDIHFARAIETKLKEKTHELRKD